MKADYRPTFPFQVSVVLIEPQAPASSALPVLSRSISAQAEPASQFGSQSAQLLEIQLPTGQTAAAPGDAVVVTGTGLGAATQVALPTSAWASNILPSRPRR